MKKDVKYYAVDDLKKVVCTTQRTASVSMVESLGPSHEGSQTRKISMTKAFALKRQGWKILIWIRNPFDRLACAYYIFGRNCDFADFLERAMTETNPHWSPVTQLHTYDMEFLPTDVFLFENLEKTWAKELPGYSLIHIGANPDRKTWDELVKNTPNELLIRVLDFWDADLELRQKLLFKVKDQPFLPYQDTGFRTVGTKLVDAGVALS